MFGVHPPALVHVHIDMHIYIYIYIYIRPITLLKTTYIIYWIHTEWASVRVSIHAWSVCICTFVKYFQSNETFHKFYSFENCNRTRVPIIFHDVQLFPDPIVVTGSEFPLTVTYNISVTESVGANGNKVEVNNLKLTQIPILRLPRCLTWNIHVYCAECY